jgi:Glycosyltransferase family 87
LLSGRASCEGATGDEHDRRPPLWPNTRDRPTHGVHQYDGRAERISDRGLIGGTLYLIPIRPVLAGICLGLLSYKPQYGLLFPLVLIAASQWRVFFSAGATAILLAFVSWLAFGTESWQAFFHWLPMFSQAYLTEGKVTCLVLRRAGPWWRGVTGGLGVEPQQVVPG